MAITSKTVSAPKTSTSASKARVPASYSTGKAGSAPKVRGNIAKTIARSSKRMHQAAKITDQRPEILAMLDFKPLYATGGDLTLAGKMFKARVSERSQTLEAIRDMLTELEDTLPDEFTAATNQYASALAATEADIALLKLMILLREYATHSARFVDFKGEYEPPEELEVDLFGVNVASQIRNILGIKSSKNRNSFWKTAAPPFLQILSDIPLCSYAIIPSQMQKNKRTAGATEGVAKRFKSKIRERLPVLTTGFVVRDMVASYEFTKLSIGDEVDDDFLAICESALGSKFITSNIDQPFSGFKNLIGEDSWVKLRRSTYTESLLNTETKAKISEMLRTKKGIIGKSKTKLNRETIFLPLKATTSYGTSEYLTIEGLVDEAFSGPDPLNFDEFNETLGDFTQSMHDLETFGKTMFRLGEKADGYADPRDYALVADEMPFNLGPAAAVILDVWNRRFVSAFYSAAYSEIDEYLSPEHMMYNRMIAWLIIRDDYETAYGFVSALVSDYENGFLTASGLPEEIVLDEETNETEMSPTAYVLPGTSTPASLDTVGTRLGSKLSAMSDWFNEKSSYSPKIDTQKSYDDGYPYPKEGYNLANRMFGSAQNGDRRYVNPMFVGYLFFTENNRTVKGWRGIKIASAEIIDTIMEIMGALMSPLHEVEAVPDGDPIFPSLTESKSPYGSGSWSFCDPAYESMATEMWVPTIEAWHDLFARKTSRETRFRNANFKNHAKNIMRALAALMSNFDMVKIFSAGSGDPADIAEGGLGDLEWTSGTTRSYSTQVASIGLAASSTQSHEGVGHVSFFKNVRDSVDNLLASSWDDLEDIDYTEAEGVGASWANKRLNAMHKGMKEFLLESHENDVALELLYDFVGDYATRVDNYSAAVQGLVEGEDSALATFVESIRETGDAGIDLLQNLSPNQLALKQIALAEERGDEDNAFLPTLAILTKSEIKAVRLLARETKAVAPEGDNAKIILVGLPAGMFETLDIDNDFAVRVSYVDIEYPQIVFRGRMYPFYKDVYVDPDDLEKSLSGVDTFEELVKKVRFSKLVVEVEESNDTSASIEVSDDIKTKRARTKTMIPYSNHAASEILKIYCRIMLGLNFAESAFLGTAEGIQIPINDYAADLAGAMAAGLETIGEFSEDLAASATSVLSELSVIEDDAFVSGELEAVDEALLTNLRDAFQTRLFSAGVMRSRVMSAKMFDRIFALAVDPDEFYIVAPDDTDVSGVTTPQLILDFYLQKGIIEETGEDAPFRYKLAPRTTAEGRMAFGKFFVSIVSTPTNLDRTFE